MIGPTWREFWLGVVLPTLIFIGALALVVFFTNGCSTS